MIYCTNVKATAFQATFQQLFVCTYEHVVVATKMEVCMGKYTPIGSAAGGSATAPPPAGRCTGKWAKHQ